jgi:hypothetical protein
VLDVLIDFRNNQKSDKKEAKNAWQYSPSSQAIASASIGRAAAWQA